MLPYFNEFELEYRLNLIFDEYTTAKLFDIFNRAALIDSTDLFSVTELQLELDSIIKEQARIISKSSDGIYLINKASLVLLISIHGVWFVYNNVLFDEGELSVRNVRWIEKEKIVTFDLFYIVQDSFQHFIFHYPSKEDEAIFKSMPINTIE